jgi:hypothetical protein
LAVFFEQSRIYRIEAHTHDAIEIYAAVSLPDFGTEADPSPDGTGGCTMVSSAAPLFMTAAVQCARRGDEVPCNIFWLNEPDIWTTASRSCAYAVGAVNERSLCWRNFSDQLARLKRVVANWCEAWLFADLISHDTTDGGTADRTQDAATGQDGAADASDPCADHGVRVSPRHITTTHHANHDN